jgi:hypothetical protein
MKSPLLLMQILFLQNNLQTDTPHLKYALFITQSIRIVKNLLQLVNLKLFITVFLDARRSKVRFAPTCFSAKNVIRPLSCSPFPGETATLGMK